MKNELIVARWTGQKKRSARARLHEVAENMGLQAWLHRRLPGVAASVTASHSG